MRLQTADHQFRQRFNFTKWLSLSLLLAFVSMFLMVITANAQSRTQIVCDTTFDKRDTIRPLPGSVYRVILTEQGNPTYQIERVTASGSEILEVPIPPELIGAVFAHVISPDGRYLALTPYEHNTPLVVWKIGTTELASTLLPESDIHYLNRNIVPTIIRERKITWTSNSEILIRYFDLQSPSILLAEKRLTIVDTPFQILEGVRAEISYPNLDIPPDHASPTLIFSPQQNYVVLVSEYLGFRIQVYDNQNEIPTLIADFQPDDTRIIRSLPIWTPDEQQFFMLYRKNPGSSPVQNVVAQVYLEQGFQLNHDLQLALETALGQNVTVSHPSMALLTKDGDKLVLRVYDPDSQIEYLVVYHVNSGNVIAICDDGEINSQSYFPLWGPGEEYFGYWNNGWLIAYDLNSGEGYRTDGTGFIGWTGDS